VTQDEEFLHNMAHEFEEGFNSSDVDRIMRFYGDTYVDINLRNPVQTNQERREYYARVIRRGLSINVKPDDIVIRGDLAFVRGTILFTRRAANASETKRSELRYLEICERTLDGTWLVVWGMDGPIQEYSPDRQTLLADTI
jgi:ketosteroid isomerase-like protein